MARLLAAIALLALATTAEVDASPRRRATRSTGFPAGMGSRILWIAAHPDDEIVVSPLLGNLCIESGASCSFLVLTSGENGTCKLPGGCTPDLRAIREAEMDRSAGFFGARLIQWRFSDVMDDVISRWSAEAGGRPALLSMVRDAIAREAPSLVLTFDPVHGTTCHPAHRAVAELVSEAIDSMKIPLFFLETFVTFDATGPQFRSAIAPSDSIVIDAQTSWHYLVDVVRIHQSQFTPAEADAIAAAPLDQQRVTISPREGARIYVSLCP